MHDSNTSAWYNSDDTFYANTHSSWNAWLDIDNVTAKCHLLATCKARGIPVSRSS